MSLNKDMKTTKRIMKIKWRDSQRYDNQEFSLEEFKVCIIESYGFLVKEDKDSITLCRDIINGTDFRGTICIPKENIIK